MDRHCPSKTPSCGAMSPVEAGEAVEWGVDAARFGVWSGVRFSAWFGALAPSSVAAAERVHEP